MHAQLLQRSVWTVFEEVKFYDGAGQEFSDYDLHGIFSSEKKAQEYVNKQPNWNNFAIEEEEIQ